MGPPSSAYAPKAPAQSVLYQVVHDHFETFRAEAARAHDRDGLPRFVEEEFRSFLRCGFLAGGFARFQCARCRLDRLVPFSCKGRAVCPSCGGRRMAERAAHLVDDVFPVVPVRQWVLSLPHRLRYVLAWDHALCRAVSGAFVQAVLSDLRRRATRRWTGCSPRSTGASVGCWCGEACRAITTRAARPIRGARRHRCWPGSRRRPSRVGGHSARGPARRCAGGVRPRSCSRSPRRASGRVTRGGTASICTRASSCRRGIEPGSSGCRYALRPPIAADRLHLTADGQVVLDLRHRWADGTTRLVFEPLELLERLAALTPGPRIDLLLYYGVLGARSAWRSRLACPRCGDRLELIALIEDPTVVRRILSHLGLPTELPAARATRPPPLPLGRRELQYNPDDMMAP